MEIPLHFSSFHIINILFHYGGQCESSTSHTFLLMSYCSSNVMHFYFRKCAFFSLHTLQFTMRIIFPHLHHISTCSTLATKHEGYPTKQFTKLMQAHVLQMFDGCTPIFRCNQSRLLCLLTAKRNTSRTWHSIYHVQKNLFLLHICSFST